MIARTTAWLQTPSQPTALAQLQAVTGLPGAAQNQREIKPLTLAPGPITHKIRVATPSIRVSLSPNLTGTLINDAQYDFGWS